MKPKSTHRSERFKSELQKRRQESKPLKTLVKPTKGVFDEMVPFKLLSQDKLNVGSNLKKLMDDSLESTKEKS